MKKQFQPDHKYVRFKLWKWICAYQATAKGAHDRSKTKTALVKHFDFSFFDHEGGQSDHSSNHYHNCDWKSFLI